MLSICVHLVYKRSHARSTRYLFCTRMPDHSLQAPLKYKFHGGVLSTNALGDPSQLLLSDWEQEVLCGDTSDEVFRLLNTPNNRC